MRTTVIAFLLASGLGLAQEKQKFEPYERAIPGFPKVTYSMVPIPGGKVTIGAPASDTDKQENETDQVEVEVKPFWMGKYEVTWDEFDVFAFSFDSKQAKQAEKDGKPLNRTPLDIAADGVTRPTPPYVNMTFGYGHDRYPAICMTSHAAKKYCEWLSAKTGHKYRLPTEAEWEYACRAGSTTRFHFGDDASKLKEYDWYADNSNEKPHPIGQLKPNKFGLYDMHGNVYEWCQDKYFVDYHKKIKPADGKPAINPLVVDDKKKWHSVKGGSWRDDAALCRSSSRLGSEEDWSIQDPQQPRSIWWHTDAHWVGFRLVREVD